MITNEKQYGITKAKVEQFRRAFDQAAQKNELAPLIHPRALQAMQDGLASQLVDLQEELSEYEKLKTGEVTFIEVQSVMDLAKGLVKARIVRNWTQKDLAGRLGLREQQIQRYEATMYRGVALERLQKVADALHLRVQERMTIEKI